MKTTGQDNYGGALEMNQKSNYDAVASTRYHVECVAPDGKVKWVEEFDNLVTTAGKNSILEETFRTPVAGAWAVGLKDTGSPTVGDTMAAHGTWLTISPYSNATDPVLTLAAASGGSANNSASKAVFNINATDTVYGAFVKDNTTVDSATGILYGVGDFGAPRAVASGDTLNVTITLTIT